MSEITQAYDMPNSPWNSCNIEKIIDKLLLDHPDRIEQVKENLRLGDWFVGQVMKETKGKANPYLATRILLEKINV